MECSCGGQGTSAYLPFTTVKEAEAAGFAVDKAPCVIATKDCPCCKRHSQVVWYGPDACEPKKKVDLLSLMMGK
ncbi:hypothetical protein G379_gp175 [Dickeya phage vB-DsoM-LIMEstone1]|uniref:Uncharacterized protein n=9 Tax=Limestonevirus limestone TaxID=1091052 RepID=I0J2Q7_9CAUD|nr:hypothetical protein G379_gp175 [Dickeya phage vB-DsoM-LIMEstone1]ASD51416.1 hypothetical protein [Dickeya phage XF4]ATW62036.1 hypothetical protein [Dickeya phage PP35]AYN55411.1 hypothetical protein [Dickeya phage Coodle]AYN55608.1 hypothetical protein [Dickeya phage Kamild]QHB41738.1 hypothetical protein [Dickeya phage Ds9CZ]QHB41941.1 hypothetical protein [Dickeya phage Ds16CZ]QHB42540.1 hypothetical protein [Dickeya phage Ds25CZ]QHB42769.1 hypothetical protein [Dickeya phage Ds3CZ]